MKKSSFIVIYIFLIFNVPTFAQILSGEDETAYPCSPVSFSVIASGFPTNMGAVQFYIPLDTTQLEYVSYVPGTIPSPTVYFNPGNLRLYLIWTNTNPLNINGTVVTFNLYYKGGSNNLIFSGGEFTTTALESVFPSYDNGTVNPIPKVTYYVDAAVGSSGTGLSWASALKTITEATNKPLTPGDEVLVKPGTYNEALVIKSNGSELVPVKYGVTLSDTNKITFPAGTDLSCVSPASYPGRYMAYVFRSWKCNSGAYPILSVNDAQDYVIVDHAAFVPETGASGDTSLVQAAIGLPVFYNKYSSDPANERIIVNSSAAAGSKANCYIGTPLGATGDSATAASYNVIDGFDLTGSPTNRVGLRVQSSGFNIFKNGRIYNLDSIAVLVSGSSAKPARYNIIAGNQIYNTFQRALKVGKHNGTTAGSNFVMFTLFKDNEVYVQDDAGSANDRLWNMADVHKNTAFTALEGNIFRSYLSQSAGKGTVEIWDNARKTILACNFFRDIGKSFVGTNAIIYVRNNNLNVNVFNNVLLNSSQVNDDMIAFRLNAAGHPGSKVVYNTVFNIDNGILFEDSGATPPVFDVQDNILYINYSLLGLYFQHTGTTGRFNVSHNCYPTTPTTAGQPYHAETGRQVGDPQFVNPTFFSSPHGVQLKSTSICLNNGTPVSGISRDYNLVARDASPGIGAFETYLTDCFWTGKISPDWHNYLNWNPELVPTNLIQAVIPLKTNLPVISGSNAVCKGLQLQNGSTVVINNGRLLTVY